MREEKIRMKNKYFITALIVILIINLFIFNKILSNRENDIFISKVKYQEQNNTSIVELKSDKIFPEKEIEVNLVFDDGSIEKRYWSLTRKSKSWSFPHKKINSVLIASDKSIDWNDKNNVWYFKEDWSNEVKLASLSAHSDLSFEVDDKKYIYIIYVKKQNVILEKKDILGNSIIEPKILTTSSQEKPSNLFIKIVSQTNKRIEALVGWNRKNNNKESFHLQKITFLDNNEIISENILSKNRSALKSKRILDIEEAVDKNHYCLTVNMDESFKFEIIKFIDTNIKEKITIPLEKEYSHIKFGKIIPGNKGINIIWIEKNNWRPSLYFMKINYDGIIITPPQKITEFTLNLARSGLFQIVNVNDENFHMAWVDNNSKRIQYLNYLIFNDKGQLVEKWIDYKDVGGYCPGISLLNNNNIIELVYSKYFGHLTVQSQRNTDILWTKIRPDMTTVVPSQILVSSSKYENYPVLKKTAKGYNYLFWKRDEGDNSEIYYSTTDPETIEKIPSKFRTKPLYTFFSLFVNSIYSIIIVLMVWGIHILPITFLIVVIYNILIKPRNSFIYWLIAIMLIFAVKIYSISLVFPWENSVFFLIYKVELVILAFVLIVFSLYWYVYSKKEQMNKTFFSNLLLVVWILASTYISYFLCVQEVLKN